MDPITHGLFGATIAMLAVRDRKHYPIAALAGCMGGMAPDLDIVIRSASDPLLAIVYHRHFTHAMVATPLVGAVVAGFLKLFVRDQMSFRNVWIFATLGAFMHGIIDATTAYGTHLFWPFTNRRDSWNIMAIIDPIVTVLLLIGVVAALRSKTKNILTVCAVLTACYFGFGALQKARVVDAMQDIAQKRGHTIAFSQVQPTIFNSILWRSVYVSSGRIYMDGIRSNVLGDIKRYPGTDVALFDTASLNDNSVQAHDIERFRFFAAGLLARSKKDPLVIADMRYSGLPQEASPMWGIRIDPKYPEQHVTFERLNGRRKDDLGVFWSMLKGKELN